MTGEVTVPLLPCAASSARRWRNAVVLADSHGDPAQAAKILDGALARMRDAPAVERVEALAYRAELAVTLDDPARLGDALAELRTVELTDDERARVATALADAEELARLPTWSRPS